MKSLEEIYRKNWATAFHAERALPRTGLVALPKEARTYYRVESYLVGVVGGNRNTLSLSAFARVLAAHPSGSCAMCLNELFEECLFPMCQQQGMTAISARLEPGGRRVFEELTTLRPGVELTPDGYYWSGVIYVPN